MNKHQSINDFVLKVLRGRKTKRCHISIHCKDWVKVVDYDEDPWHCLKRIVLHPPILRRTFFKFQERYEETKRPQLQLHAFGSIATRSMK